MNHNQIDRISYRAAQLLVCVYSEYARLLRAWMAATRAIRP